MGLVGNEDISKWASSLDTVISNTDGACVDRVVVLESTASTMDAAASFAGQKPGLVLVASQQTAGRGQRGRRWHDSNRQTLPCTFVIDPSGLTPMMLSASIACAVHETIRAILPSSVDVKIKWPNDIVIRSQWDRKIAGVLIERKDGLTYVGIGINCLQGDTDWDEELDPLKTISLSQSGVQVSRLELMCSLIERLSQWLSLQDTTTVRQYFADHDAMLGTLRTFSVNRDCFHGEVVHIDPLEGIHIQTSTGMHVLPAALAKHVTSDNPCDCR